MVVFWSWPASGELKRRLEDTLILLQGAQDSRHVTVASDAQTEHETCGDTVAATVKYEASTPGTRRSVPRVMVECHGWYLISRGRRIKWCKVSGCR